MKCVRLALFVLMEFGVPRQSNRVFSLSLFVQKWSSSLCGLHKCRKCIFLIVTRMPDPHHLYVKRKNTRFSDTKFIGTQQTIGLQKRISPFNQQGSKNNNQNSNSTPFSNVFFEKLLNITPLLETSNKSPTHTYQF